MIVGVLIIVTILVGMAFLGSQTERVEMEVIEVPGELPVNQTIHASNFQSLEATRRNLDFEVREPSYLPDRYEFKGSFMSVETYVRARALEEDYSLPRE